MSQKKVKISKIFRKKKFFSRVKIRSFGVEIRPNFWVSTSENAKKKFFLPQGEPALGRASQGAVRLSDFQAGSAQNEPKKMKNSIFFFEKKVFFPSKN